MGPEQMAVDMQLDYVRFKKANYDQLITQLQADVAGMAMLAVLMHNRHVFTVERVTVSRLLAEMLLALPIRHSTGGGFTPYHIYIVYVCMYVDVCVFSAHKQPPWIHLTRAPHPTQRSKPGWRRPRRCKCG